jgi:hypothetical protein
MGYDTVAGMPRYIPQNRNFDEKNMMNGWKIGQDG